MSGGNEFFTTAKGSIEQAMAFWPEPREKSAGADAKRSAEFYIAILLAMLLFSGVVGFVLGIATFITLFLRLGAQVDWWKAIAGGAAFVLFLGVISHQLTLRYPTGLMQEIVTLPWPLQ